MDDRLSADRLREERMMMEERMREERMREERIMEDKEFEEEVRDDEKTIRGRIDFDDRKIYDSPKKTMLRIIYIFKDDK